MSSSPIKVVFSKEVRENLRDRRAVASSLFFGPLLGPVIFAILITIITTKELDKAEKPLELPVVGAQHAPNLIRFLEQQGTVIKSIDGLPEDAIRSQDEDVIVRITEAYPAAASEGRPAPVEVVLDRSRREARSKISRVQRLLKGYGKTVGRLRLLARGIDPTVTRAVAVIEFDLSTPESRGAMLMSMLPYFMLMTLFMGGMYLAIDTTAGEKERQSLEPLLINPVPRWKLMAGKMAATFTFAVLSLILSITGFAISMKFIPSEKMGLDLDILGMDAVMIFIAVVPLGIFAAALQTIIAAFAKSFREAQTYLSFLMILPMIPVMATLINPVKTELWMMFVPILSQDLLAEKVLRGDSLDPLNLLVSVVSTLFFGLILAFVAARLYNRERLAFA